MVLLLGILLVAALVWLLIAQPWRGTAAEQPDSAADSDRQTAVTDIPVPTEGEVIPSASGSPEPTSSIPAEGALDASAVPTAKPCTAGDVLVEAVTDQETYAAGQNPQLSISLTNRSAVDCALNVGTSGQSFIVSSGNDTWWRSTDCQSEPSDMVVLLAAGQTVSSASPLTWDRTRSAVDSCTATDRPHAPGSGASYHLTVSIGGVDSAQSTQFFLS